MILPADDTDSLVRSLERLLDEEAALLDVRCSQVTSLCAAIAGRDEDATERLLEQMERGQQLQDAADAKVDAARRALGERLGCPGADARLSDLIDRLAEPSRGRLAQRRDEIVVRIEALQRQHMRAVVLLGECARLNRLLTEALFPGSERVTTYSAAGPDSWQPAAGLVDTEL